MARKKPAKGDPPVHSPGAPEHAPEGDSPEINPVRRVPGILGRSRWFRERAGDRVGSLDVERLLRAVTEAEEIPDLERLRAGLDRQPATQAGEVKVGGAADVADPLALGPPIAVADFEDESAVVSLPMDAAAVKRLDLRRMVVAEVSASGSPRLVAAASPRERDGVVVARVFRPGKYRAFAMPNDPSTRAAVETLALYLSRVRPDTLMRIFEQILEIPDRRAADLVGSDISLLEYLQQDGDTTGLVALARWARIRFAATMHWEPVGPSPGANFGGIGRVSQIDIHPTDGRILIAGAAGGGVWRTDDEGANWRPLMDGERTLTIGAVAFAPSNPNILYAASGEDGGGYSPAWGGAGIYRSDRGGDGWQLMTRLPSTRFSAIVVHPTDPNTLYVAGDRGLHKSIDGGLNWLTNPGEGSLKDGRVTDVVIAHDDPDRVYLGIHNRGVYRSTTGGISQRGVPAFVQLGGANQLPIDARAGWIKLAIGRAGTNGSRFLAAKLGPRGSRIFTSINGGDTWSERARDVATARFDEWCSLIQVDPTDEDVLYAGASVELKRTTNGGASNADWRSIARGVHPDQQDLVFDPVDPRRIYLANDGGVYRSANRGTAWNLASGGLQVTQLYDFDISERDPNILAGGAQDNGIYYRNAAGVWRHIPWGDGTQAAIDPTDPQIFYFSAQEGVPSHLGRSLDGGRTRRNLGQTGLSGDSPWVTIMKLDPTDPLNDPANNRTLYVCGERWVFRSENGGRTWSRVEDGAGQPFTTSGEISALDIARSDPSILYLGTSRGAVYRAVNGGRAAADWSRIDTPDSAASGLFPNVQVQAIRVNPGDVDDVWVVFGGAGVTFSNRPNLILNPLGISHLFRSTNAGVDWEDASGLASPTNLPDVPTSAVAISDIDPEMAYAGTDVGVFLTIDGGATWTTLQDGLPRSPVTELLINRRFQRLYAATMGRGIFVRDI
jgi:hypothetical protein